MKKVLALLLVVTLASICWGQDTYTNGEGHLVYSPTPYTIAGVNNFPCKDGMISHSEHRMGACSHHGGFADEAQASSGGGGGGGCGKKCGIAIGAVAAGAITTALIVHYHHKHQKEKAEALAKAKEQPTVTQPTKVVQPAIPQVPDVQVASAKPLVQVQPEVKAPPIVHAIQPPPDKQCRDIWWDHLGNEVCMDNKN